MSKANHPSLYLFPFLTAVGCGPGSVPETDPFSCVESQTLCVTLEVPAEYSGTPRELATGFYDTSDTARPPDESLAGIEYPSIVAGETYELSHNQVDFEGDFYLLFILFDEDGGTWVPEPDIDYTAVTPEPIHIDGNPIELGSLTLAPAD